MIWTKEKPTKPGWYWWRYELGRKYTPMYISQAHIMHSDVFTVGTFVLFLGELPGEWQGPITPTEEPQKSECGHYECNDEDCYGK